MADFVPKKSRWSPGRPQMACKRRTNGGTQWNTCRRTTLGAKLVGKMHPMVSKRFQNGSFWAKMPILTKMPLLAIGDPKWRTQVEQMMVLNGIHAGEHKQKSAIGNCWGIQCINTLCLFLTFRLFLILVMHIFLSMHLCMRGEKMANMMSA